MRIEWLLAQYKKLVSPLLPPACRFVPTCSEYAAEAMASHGIFRGGALTLWRLLRCNPFAHGGWDPVPHRHSTGESRGEHPAASSQQL